MSNPYIETTSKKSSECHAKNVVTDPNQKEIDATCLKKAEGKGDLKKGSSAVTPRTERSDVECP